MAKVLRNSLAHGQSSAPASHRRRPVRFLPEDLIVDEFFSAVPGKSFDLCIISTRTKAHINPLEKFSPLSKMPENHNDLPSTRSQALPP